MCGCVGVGGVNVKKVGKGHGSERGVIERCEIRSPHLDAAQLHADGNEEQQVPERPPRAALVARGV